MGIPVLIYGSEMWAVAKKIKGTVATEIHFLCLAVGVYLRDQRRSTDIWRELVIFKLHEKVKLVAW
jgi:hypothetical protein